VPACPTPYYLIDEARLRTNLDIVVRLREMSGTKSVLALKCFATWGVFPIIAEYLDGTTSSSLYEARLGHEHFGKETHAYSVAWSQAEVSEVATFADKVIFNSAAQLRRFHDVVGHRIVGVRVNPGISHSHFDLADPARRFSRLGITDPTELRDVAPLVTGLMFHFNCENDDVASMEHSLATIAERFGDVLANMSWVSLGGGIAFTNANYPIERLATALKSFAERFDVQVYLEPGEAVVTGTTELVTTVLDVVHNEVDVAVIDASVEAHTPDHLIYGTTPALAWPQPGPHRVIVAGRTCLAGDSFGEHHITAPLAVGDEVRIADTAGYTMVKASWFNGINRPAIAVRRLDGSTDVLRSFHFGDFAGNLS
jgi:carboxynorspermidine decarboxylase